MFPTILITGCEGQLGTELVRSCEMLGRVQAFSRSTLDLSDFEKIEKTILLVKPQFILNAAAYTAVDKAELEVEISNKVNGSALGVIGKVAKKIGAAIIHFSTDYVFDGTQTRPYVETDATNPVSQYGRSKLLGEQCLSNSGVLYLNFRTSWVYANHGKNFLLTMLKLAKERETLSIVNDQVGAPTCARSLAHVTAKILKQASLRPHDFFEKNGGTYHLTCGGQTTWFEFANEIFKLDKHAAAYKLKSVRPITTAEYPLPAKRPLYSVMNNSAFENAFGLKMPHWHEALKSLMSELNQENK